MTFSSMIDGSPIAALITDPNLPDNPVIACNIAFERLTGYSRSEIIGKNCRFLSGEKSRPELKQMIEDAGRNNKPMMTEVVNFKKDGTPFINALLIVPLYDDEGNLIHFLGSQIEVPETSKMNLPEARIALRQKIEGLPARQRQVLAGMVAGKRNKQIAHDLGIGERTVKMHRAAVIDALDGKTSVDAIRYAVEAGWP